MLTRDFRGQRYFLHEHYTSTTPLIKQRLLLGWFSEVKQETTIEIQLRYCVCEKCHASLCEAIGKGHLQTIHVS